MIKRKFPRAFMLDVLNDDVEDARVCEITITGTSRWSIHYSMVFKYDGKTYQARYREGATEMQDESPWEYESEVECIEVRPVTKTVTVYEPVEESNA